MFALSARIQTLLRGHKYAVFLFQRADFGYGTKVLFKVEVIWECRRMSFVQYKLAHKIIRKSVNFLLITYNNTLSISLLKITSTGNHKLPVIPQSTPTINSNFSLTKNSSQRETISYICGLRTRIECGRAFNPQVIESQI